MNRGRGRGVLSLHSPGSQSGSPIVLFGRGRSTLAQNLTNIANERIDGSGVSHQIEENANLEKDDTNFSLCVICQTDTTEKVTNPKLSKAADEHINVFTDFIYRAAEFEKLGALPLSFNIKNADAMRWEHNNAKWHPSCRKLFCTSKLERVDKAKGKTDTTRQSFRALSTNNKTSCVFCQKENHRKLHKCSTTNMDHRLREMSLALQDDNMIRILSEGDAIALDLVYHRDCYVIYCRRYTETTTLISSEPSQRNFSKEQLMCHIEEQVSEGVEVFSMHELVDTYQEIGGETTNENPTRLKNHILERFPDFEEHKGSRRRVYLIASKKMRTIVNVAMHNASEDSRTLVRAAVICRRSVENCETYKFSGSFVTKPKIPEALVNLVHVLLYGEKSSSELHMEASQANNMSQILMLNMKNLAKCSRLEMPLPLYVGLWIHAETRCKAMIEHFHEMGICVSYKRVVAVENQLAESIIHQTNTDGILCPINLQKKLFTVAALDNLDHNLTSRTASSSFHGTAISIFQLRDRGNPGIPRILSFCKPQNMSIKLPTSYTTVPPLVRPLISSIPLSRTTNKVEKQIDQAVHEEQNWIHDVSKTISEGVPKTEKAMWSTYHASKLPENSESLPAIDCILPVFYESSSDPKMVKHGMDIVNNIVSHLNAGQIPILTVDQPLYAIAKKIQWTFPEELGENKMVVMMGGLHIEMALWKTLGNILQDCGWAESIAQAGIATSGTASSFITASDPMKTRYAHQVTIMALNILMQNAYLSSGTPLSIEQWVNNCSKTNPTFTYWKIVMKYEQLILIFVRSHRERNFALFLDAMKSLVCLFFTFDHQNYARWLSVFLFDLESLPDETLDCFQQGFWTINRTMRKFSSIAIDQAHEQNNKVLKNVGGIIGLTENPELLEKWVLIGSTLGQLIDEYAEVNNKMASFDVLPHHESGATCQKRYIQHVKNLVEVIQQNGNPFMGSEHELLSLTGRVCKDSSSSSIQALEIIGQSQYEDFVFAVLINRTRDIQVPIKKNKMTFFKVTKPRKSVVQSRISFLKDQTTMFGQLFVTMHTRAGDLPLFFQHESANPPPSMKMMSNKSDLLHCILSDVNAVPDEIVTQKDEQDNCANSDAPNMFDAVILDGGSLIHSLPPKPMCSTFDDFASTVFMPRIRWELRSCSRLDIIWDCYYDLSIKGSTRLKREETAGCERIRQRVGGPAKLPVGASKWKGFLLDSTNKEELFAFLSSEAMSQAYFPDNKDLYITADKNVLHSGPSSQMEMNCNHEEADTRIVVHLMHALHNNCKSVLIRTGDTDVFVIIVSHFHSIISQIADANIWIAFGSGKHLQFLHVNTIATYLGMERSMSLAMFHALSGCDSVCGLKMKGKRLWWTALKKCPSVTTALMNVFISPFADISAEDLNILEWFICRLYDPQSNVSKVNELRLSMFSKRSQDVERIPPTKDALLQHIRRAQFQASVWACSHKSTIPSHSPLSFGWAKENGLLVPVWMTQGTAIEVFGLRVKCACKSECKNACTCQKSNLLCTQLCKCKCI